MTGEEDDRQGRAERSQAVPIAEPAGQDVGQGVGVVVLEHELGKDGLEQLNHYRATLLHLGTEASGRVQAIYINAKTAVKQAKNLNTLVKEVEKLDWYSAREEGLGTMYEDLLERNAGEKKSGAGQYFTPRPLIDCCNRSGANMSCAVAAGPVPAPC